MREVIKKVVTTEAEAKQMVQAARAEADRLQSEARKLAPVSVERARQEARSEAVKLLAEAGEQARREKAERLKQIATEIHRQVTLDEVAVRQVVDAAVRCICGCGREREEAP